MSKAKRILSHRKLRKLRRDPRLFFKDAVRKRTDAASELAIRTASQLSLRGLVSSERRFTAISAVYNVEKYLDRFFESIEAQTLRIDRHLELIMVDDGSVDGSREIIERWQAKYPDCIRYIRKENGGQASARNVGLGEATGDWITFIDPDDFVHPRYFEKVDSFLDEHSDEEVGLICCKWIFYHEDGDRYVDAHPLDFRFDQGSCLVPHEPHTDTMLSSATVSFFRRDLLSANQLRFNESLRPNFEDGDFAGRYVIAADPTGVGYVADAVYYYRKRADGTSTSDQGWSHPGRFGVVPREGYLALLERARRELGVVPVSLQKLVLYDLIWLYNRIVDNESSVAFLSATQRDELHDTLNEVFAHIDPATILGFGVAGCWFFHKVAFLGLYKGLRPPRQIVYVDGYDATKRAVRLRYFFFGELPAERFVVDGTDRLPANAKVRVHDFLGQVFVKERRVLLSLEGGYGDLRVEVGGDVATVSLAGAQSEVGVSRAMVARAYGREPGPGASWPGARGLRKEAQSASARRRFDGAWMLIDRDTQADDNAEHLYRWIRRTRPDINAFFVLRSDSHDWSRLEAEGFRLIPFGSRDHHLLLLNARHVISSHADSFVLRVLPEDAFGDLLDFRFTFLQHGVIRDDISGWLNKKQIDLFVTSSPMEHESVAGRETRYKFDGSEVKMVGLSRHDGLLERTEPTEKVVLIMPTWRQYLVGTSRLGTTERVRREGFESSRYAKAWGALLRSERLKRLCERHGYRVVFFPHANMQMYADSFGAPDWVEVATHATEPILQKLYRRAALLVTDYSSVFFEMGVLGKPVVYYQFDRDEMYGGSHPSRLGYFEFARDGFGPVTETEDELLEELEDLLERQCEPSDEYRRRMSLTLPLRDGKNRERTVEAIEALDSPVLRSDDRSITLREVAEAASRDGAWGLARSSWSAIARGEDASALAILRSAEAASRCGAPVEARALIERAGAIDEANLLRLRALITAELAVAEGRSEGVDGLLAALDEEASPLVLERAAAVLRLAGSSAEWARAVERLDALGATREASLERAERAYEARAFLDAASRFASEARPGWPDSAWVRAAESYARCGQWLRASAAVGQYLRAGGREPRALTLSMLIAAGLTNATKAREQLGPLKAAARRWSDADVAFFAKVMAELELAEEADELLSSREPSSELQAARVEIWTRAGWWSRVRMEPVPEPGTCKEERRRMLVLARAEAELRAGDLVDATERLERACATWPSSTHASALLTEAHAQMGSWELAAGRLTTLLREPEFDLAPYPTIERGLRLGLLGRWPSNHGGASSSRSKEDGSEEGEDPLHLRLSP